MLSLCQRSFLKCYIFIEFFFKCDWRVLGQNGILKVTVISSSAILLHWWVWVYVTGAVHLPVPLPPAVRGSLSGRGPISDATENRPLTSLYASALMVYLLCVYVCPQLSLPRRSVRYNSLVSLFPHALLLSHVRNRNLVISPRLFLLFPFHPVHSPPFPLIFSHLRTTVISYPPVYVIKSRAPNKRSYQTCIS